ncbi:hypothetical protein F5883DRAFT_522860 [Diaporthe sp. PMI_573]|nr:hypothetical protein F5883DRAFT_522860 [Diaporthaceae sp. PMI_573]
MNSIRRLASSAFFKTAGHIRPPMRSFVSSKLVPAATGAAVFGIGCMMGSPGFGHKLLLGGKSGTIVPLSLDANTHNTDGRTDAARSIEYETGPAPATYGAQLARIIDRDVSEVRQLSDEQSKNPSHELALEVQRRLLRLKSLYDAVWALNMIGMANCPEVWRLLEHNTSELNMPFTDPMSTLQKAQEAINCGETETLKIHIKRLIENNHRLGRSPPRPASALEEFMQKTPAGSAVLSRLTILQQIAAQNTEASRFLLDDTMYWLWWVLEQKIRAFSKE